MSKTLQDIHNALIHLTNAKTSIFMLDEEEAKQVGYNEKDAIKHVETSIDIAMKKLRDAEKRLKNFVNEI